MPVTARRMGAQWPVLTSVLLTVLVSAALATALAIFAGQAVPQAVHHELAAAPGTSVLVSGSATDSELASDTEAIRADMGAAFGSVPFAFEVATWSAPLGLRVGAGPAGVRAPQVEAAAAGTITANSVLTEGQWPQAPQAGQPIPAALPAATAALLHLQTGDIVKLRAITVRLTGVFRPRDPSAEYWRLDLIGVSGYRTTTQSTTYGPLVVDPAAFGNGNGNGNGFAVAAADWLAIPDTAAIPDAGLGTLAAQIDQQQQLMLDSATLGELTMTTNLPALLSGMASNVVVADSLLAIGGLLLLLLDATALTLAARLLASQRRVESAQVAARGGTRWQLVRHNAAEGVLIAVLATVGGVLAGGWLAGLLARTGPLRAVGLRTSTLTPGAVLAAALASVVCIAIVLGYPLLDTPHHAWTRRGRQSTISAIARAGIDVALVALAAVAVWELRRFSAIAPSASGGLSVDPVLALAPALALGGGTVLLLRLVPAVARAGDRLAARGRRLTAPLASWQISRRAISQAGVALLVVLAVATGMLVLSQHLSWQRSVRDQAAFAVGADVRVDTPAPLSAGQDDAIATAPGVRAAMPAAQLGYGDTGQAVAIDASKAAGVVLMRPDLSPMPIAKLFGRITPAGPPPGIQIPARLELDASLGPAALRLAPAAVTMSVQDADGNVYAVPAGTLTADGRTHRLVADVAPGLRLIAVTLRYKLPAIAPGHPAVFDVVSVADGPGTALASWQPAASSPDLAALLQSPGAVTGPAMLPAAGLWQQVSDGAQQMSFSPGFGPAFGEVRLTAPMSVPPAIPAIATRAYLDAAGVAVGSIVQISVTGVAVPVRIVAAVTAFPAMTGPGGAVIVDLATLQEALTTMSLPPAPVSEWWLSTARPPAGLPAGSSVTIPGQLAASMLGDPLSAAPQQAMLAIAVAAAVLALAGVAVSISSNFTERRAQSALLAALGVSRSAQARQLCLEELMLSAPAAVAGLALGAVLGWLLVPAVTLTAGAVAPVPPALAEFAWSLAVPLAVAVAALPVLVAAVTVAYRPDPAARMRTAEAT